MTPDFTVVVVGDLAGDDRYHSGDEAMSLAAVDLLWSDHADSKIRIIVTSSNPMQTAARLGCDALEWVGFVSCVDESARRQTLESLTADVAARFDLNMRRQGLPRLLEAVANADAVLIAGGGNLNSHWPEHIYERVAVARTAAAAGIPVVITGQTLGPRIDDHHRPLVTELLAGAAMVGVRERHSHGMALDLGVDPHRLMLQADDAVLLADGGAPRLPVGFDPGTHDVPRRFIAVTIHPFATPDDPRITSLAHQLAAVADRVGAQLLFVPHMRGAEGPGGTSDVDIAEHMAHITGGWALDDLDARSVAWAARNAWVVVSTRYHPLVFAAGAAVPALALLWDHYTAVKCRGALDHVQMGNWWVNVDDAVAGALERALSEVTRRRVEMSSWMQLYSGHLQAIDAQRQSRVARALGIPTAHPLSGTGRADDVDTTVEVPSPGRTVPEPAGHWSQTQR